MFRPSLPTRLPGENASRPRNAFFWGQYWVAKPGIPDQVIYDIVKITQEPKNKEMLGKVMNLWAVSGPEFAPTVRMGIPIHPGAARFWTEKGAKLAGASEVVSRNRGCPCACRGTPISSQASHTNQAEIREVFPSLGLNDR